MSEARLYLADASALSDEALFAVLYAKMPAERRAKIDGYVFPKDRRLCLAAGLLLAVAGDWEGSSFGRCAGLIVQVAGAALYFIGRTLTGEKGPFWAAWLDVACVTFLPVRFVMRRSIFLTLMAGFVPFEVGKILHSLLYWPVYLVVLAVSFFLLKKRR